MSAHVRYIERARDYFSGLGHTKEYRWPHFSEVPFTALKKPLSDCCITIVTTSYVEAKSEENASEDSQIVLMGDVYEIDSYLKASDLFSRHEGYDSYATNVDDVDSFFPMTRLHEAVAEGRVGSVAPFFYNAFSTYSIRRTEQIDGPAVLKGCYQHNVDAAILTGIWPLDHQTVSLLARYLEGNGVATVVMACARDIVEYCGVSRLLFTDFPIGNPCGEPFNVEQQKAIFSMALDLLESARAPRTTVQTPFIWPHGDKWKETFMTKEQPFLDEEGMKLWLQAKAAAQQSKTERAEKVWSALAKKQRGWSVKSVIRTWEKLTQLGLGSIADYMVKISG